MNKLLRIYLFVIFSVITFVFTTADLQATTLRIATYNLWNPIFEAKYSVKILGPREYPSFWKILSPLHFDLISLAPIGDEKGSDHKLTMTDVRFYYE